MIEIRSYRRVFDLERRVYRIDRVRLNPSGVPVRGVVYFLAILAVCLMLRGAPLIGAAVRITPWYLFDLALPFGTAALLTVIRIEGRTSHLAGWSIARHLLGPRHLTAMSRCATPGWRWAPGEMLVLPDGSDGRMRRLRYDGPGAVMVRGAHQRSHHRRGPIGRLSRRPGLVLAELPGHKRPARGQVIVLDAGARLTVRSGGRS